MTWRGTVPRPRAPGADDRTSYEREHDGTHDYDALSDMDVVGAWPGIADVEDLSLLAGLEAPDPEDDPGMDPGDDLE